MRKRVCTLIGTADPGSAHEENTMFFTRRQLEEVVRQGHMNKLPVWLEHGDATKEQVGMVEYAWVDSAGMHVLITLDLRLIRSRVVMEWIRSGVFSGLSLGYTAQIDKKFNVTTKKIHELSIVRVPYHSTCIIHYKGLLPPNIPAKVVGHKKRTT